MVDHGCSVFQADQAGLDQRMHNSFVVLPRFGLFGLVGEDESIAEDVLGCFLDLLVGTATG